MKKKIAIVSTFSDLCGNATYAKSLCDGLEAHCSVARIDLPQDIFRKSGFHRQQQYLKQVCEELKEYDQVNIQLEIGIFGSDPFTVRKNIFSILNSCPKKISITFHRIDIHGSLLIGALRSLKKNGIKSVPQLLLKQLLTNSSASIHRDILKWAGKRGGCRIIVHTHGEGKRASTYVEGAKENVYVHPIRFRDQPVFHESFTTQIVDAFIKRHHEKKRKVIGLVGFVSAYKNHDQVLRMMAHHQEYAVIIAGSTHPESPEYGQNTSYSSKLSHLCYDLSIEDRVLFLGALGNQDLESIMEQVDVVCLPYLETGQSGSGVASLALEASSKVVFSDTRPFRELQRFTETEPIFFEVGNNLSLIRALEMSEKVKTRFSESYSFESNIQLYLGEDAEYISRYMYRE